MTKDSDKELKTQIGNPARTFEKKLSKIEASQEEPGRLQEGSVHGEQHPEGAGTGERARSDSQSCKGVKSIGGCKLLVKSKLPGVAVSPLDLGKYAISKLPYPNWGVIWISLCGRDGLRRLRCRMIACRLLPLFRYSWYTLDRWSHRRSRAAVCYLAGIGWTMFHR